MTEYNKYGLEDLVAATIDQKPSEFQNAFNSLIMDRVQAAVQDKKMEVAQRIYGDLPQQTEEE